MSIVRRNRITIIVGAFHLLLAGAAAYAFAVFNPLTPNPEVGGVMSAATYTVTNIRYGLDAQHPHLIDHVNFTISPIAVIGANATVQAKLRAMDTTYVPCSNISAATGMWQCPVNDITVAAADQLDVRVLPFQPYGAYPLWLPLIRGPQSFNQYLPLSSMGQ
jgi:hypothetical protein